MIMLTFAITKKVIMFKIGTALLLFINIAGFSQKVKPVTYWQALIHRPDSNNIIFNFKLEEQNKKNRSLYY